MQKKDKKIKDLKRLYKEWSGEDAQSVSLLRGGGSAREYFRLSSEGKTAIGVFNLDDRENKAFLSFSKHFYAKDINVPAIYADDLSNSVYLIEDLGDVTFWEFLQEERGKNGFSEKIKSIYKKVLSELPRIQIVAGQDLDYSVCHPRKAFDKQSIMWDLNYFKYHFLKLSDVVFDEQELENDFIKFADYLLQAKSEYFLYRDFQSRNMMIKDDKVYFIDYQGGRKGALQYDVASLLFSPKAKIPPEIREELLDFYIQEAKKYTDIDEAKFKSFYDAFVLVRIMQAMGAYGFRGFFERKAHFLASIPQALKNLSYILSTAKLQVVVPELRRVLLALVDSEKLKNLNDDRDVLKLKISSFAYNDIEIANNNMLVDGFVFDCRSLPNPAKILNIEAVGLDPQDIKVLNILDNSEEVKQFISSVRVILSNAVENFLKRGFTKMNISFACTNGRHRSVYCAEKISKFLKNEFNIKVEMKHLAI